MSYEVKLAGKVPKLGNVSYVSAPFDEILKLLDVITGSNLAFARAKTGPDSIFSTNGSYIKEGLLYIPDRITGKGAKIVGLRKSLILDPKYTKSVVNAHRNNNEAKIDDEKAEDTYKKADKGHRDYRILETRDSIPVKDISTNEWTKFLFGKNAKMYEDFLRGKINQIDQYLSSEEDIDENGPFINQLWLGSLGYDSNLEDSRYLDSLNRAFGVKRKTAVSGSQKISGSVYVPKERELAKYEKVVKSVMSGDKGTKNLETILTFIERFRKE